jgi:hypothetical protein
MSIRQLLYIIVFSICIVYVSSAIFSFFGIGLDVYGNYVFFILAMLLLYMVLPKDTGKLFMRPDTTN